MTYYIKSVKDRSSSPGESDESDQSDMIVLLSLVLQLQNRDWNVQHSYNHFHRQSEIN